MKKLLLTILFCLIPCVLFAGGGFTAMLAGAGAGGAACSNNATTDYIGDKSDYTAESGLFSADTLYCISYTPSMTCSTGIFSYTGVTAKDSGDYIKVCIYNNINAQAGPHSDDTLVGCSGGDQTGVNYALINSAEEVNQAVTQGSSYWVCTLPNGSETVARTASGSNTMYYQTSSGWYTSPPANLGGTWTSTASRDINHFIKIR